MKLTIAIPSYRRPDDLRRALEAVAAQNHPADEIIVVVRQDDRETQSVVREFSSTLPVMLELVERPGMVEAVNRALDRATGEIVALTDDDAAPHADWTERMLATYQSEPDLAGLGGRDHIRQSDGRWEDGEATVVGIVRWYGHLLGYHHLGIGTRRDVDCLKGVNMSFRRSALGPLRMDRRLRGTGAQCHCDLKLCLEVRARGLRLAYDPAMVVDHFPAPRFDEDQRGAFNRTAYENEIHNITLALLDYLSPAGRMLLIPYALLIGIANGYCGLLKGLLIWPRIGVRRAVEKNLTSIRGVCMAWRTWRATGNRIQTAVLG